MQKDIKRKTLSVPPFPRLCFGNYLRGLKLGREFSGYMKKAINCYLSGNLFPLLRDGVLQRHGVFHRQGITDYNGEEKCILLSFLSRFKNSFCQCSIRTVKYIKDEPRAGRLVETLTSTLRSKNNRNFSNLTKL